MNTLMALATTAIALAGGTNNTCNPVITATDLAVICHLSGEGKCSTCALDTNCHTTKEDAAAFLKEKGDHKAYRSISGQTIIQMILAGYGLFASLDAECKQGEEKRLRLVEQLLKQGANVNATGQLGHTPLHDAILAGHLEVAQFLLKNGADPKVPISSGKYQGMDAESFGKALIKKKADPKIAAILELLAAKKSK